jgi:hypothetical protein
MKPWMMSLLLLIVSLVSTAILWMIGIAFCFLFLFVPLIPFHSGRREYRRCPVCGWETDGNERFCPYDATPLRNSDDDDRRTYNG